MKKKSLMIIILILTILLASGCGRRNFKFYDDEDAVERIEIVNVESDLNYTVLKTISNDDENRFINDLSKVSFNDYIFGDPMEVAGKAIKITYESGNYELICHYWSEYISGENTYFIWKNCSENDFEDLINKYQNTEL